jgi:ribosomal protein S18 acetylase RimI-like enzyme
MPPLTDRQEIRQLLWRDPVWAVYALGDLGPQWWPHTRWHRSGEEVALVLRAYATPILWASGSLEGLEDELAAEPRYSVQVRPESLPVLARRYDLSGIKRMWRMRLDPANFRPSTATNAFRLGRAEVPEVRALYEDGSASGESPEFFFDEMVERGIFYGCRENGRLIAVAGTHVVEEVEGIGAIGNVYVRRDCRGKGLAGLVTINVVNELRRIGIGVIALNVYQSNRAAIQVYERLGFQRHCEFLEGVIQCPA